LLRIRQVSALSVQSSLCFCSYCYFLSFTGALSAALVCASGIEILRSSKTENATALAAIKGLAYAFTPLVWEYSVTAEVFALNNFVCAALVYVLCVTLSTLVSCGGSGARGVSRVHSLSLCGGLLCGLALSNQHSSLLMVAYVVPCVLLSVWNYAPAHLLSTLLRASSGFLLGFSTYLYLPWAASTPTPGSWGSLGTLQGFVRHVLRAEYGTFRLGMIEGSESALERIVIYLRHSSQESFHVLFVGIVLAGVVYAVSVYSTPVAASAAGTSAMPGVTETTPKKEKGNKTAASKSKANNTSNAATTTTAVKAAPWSPSAVIVANLVAMWLFYVLVWHCVLSNLPLSSPMPFAVHSRFWMQPNIILYTLLTASVGYVGDVVGRKVPLFRSAVLQTGLVVVYLGALLHQRWPEADKSRVDVLHRYATAKLASILPVLPDTEAPAHSLLLSHTDLDWNPVRYLQHCEGVGLDPSMPHKSPLARYLPYRTQHTTTGVTATSTFLGASTAVALPGLLTHLSFQLIPYPWFKDTQQPLYPHVKFPATNFAGVSSDRASEGNAQLILRFLHANNIRDERIVSSRSDNGDSNDNRTALVLQNTHKTFTGGVYLDMQAVHDPEIEAFGQWRGLVLVPWGTLYRVFGPLHITQIQELHHHSYYHLRQLQAAFPAVDDKFMRKCAPGSWERAAANVFYDAHYQFALNLLTFCVEMQGKVEMKLLPTLLDRYHLSATVLSQTLSAVRKYGTFSSSAADLTKNTALAWMRLYALMDVVGKFRKEIRAEMAKLPSDVSLSQVRVYAYLNYFLPSFILSSCADTSIVFFAAALAGPRGCRGSAQARRRLQSGSAGQGGHRDFPAGVSAGQGCAGVRRCVCEAERVTCVCCVLFQVSVVSYEGDCDILQFLHKLLEINWN